MNTIDILNDPWQGHTKGEIEDALKFKLKDMDGKIGKTELFAVSLTVDNLNPVYKDDNVILRYKATSSVKYPDASDYEQLDETLVLEIQTRTTISSDWIVRPSVPFSANSLDYYELHLAPYLETGDNYIRVRAVGDLALSVWKSYTMVIANMQLIPNSVFEVPFNDSNNLNLNYLIGGNIQKYLLLQFGTGRGSDFVSDYDYVKHPDLCIRDVGTKINMTTGESFNFAIPEIVTLGRHTVKALLSTTRELSEQSVKTDIVESEYMVVTDPSTASNMVVINNVVDTVDNYTAVTFFKWASYSKDGQLPVVFKLKDSISSETLSSWTFTGKNNTYYTFNTDLSLELGNVKTVYAYMHIEDVDGNRLSDPVFVTINNQSTYAPIDGADFVLSPSNRSNQELTPLTIINNINGEVVESTWFGFDMISDGYMEVNQDIDDTSLTAKKIRALHIPAGRKLDIKYNPLKDFINALNLDTGLSGRSMTFEIDFRVYNILDEEKPIVNLSSTHPVDGEVWGFEMRPLEACVLTEKKRVRDDLNVSWAEGVRSRLTLNLVWGLNPSSDPNATKLNYARMFINGTIEREFNYNNDDSFLLEDLNLVLGADLADVDIFEIRCYQKSLSTNDVMQDYKAGLATTEQKREFSEANDILGDDGTIDFTKAKNAGYNVLGHTGHLPTYGDENKGKTKGVSLYIGLANDRDRSGTLTKLESSGQGTTAMTYYDWNLQYKVTDSSLWIGDGSAMPFGSDGYQIEEGEALAKKLVGKINFASSQQGHKMGLTWIFDEIFKQLVAQGKMSTPGQIELQPSARIAVYEKPFLFFHRETENDPWVFRYLMTWGAGKGDKPTFGYNKNTTPNMMMVEGADNDAPLANFATPWDNNIVYNASDEAWLYGGKKNINFGFGKVVEIDGSEYADESNPGFISIKNFFNFVYMHNTSALLFYDGNLALLRNNEARALGVDNTLTTPSKNNLYWLTSETGRYDIYRFDLLSNDWINAGLNGLRRNVRDEYEQFCTELGVSVDDWTIGQWDKIADKIKNVFTAHFRLHASNYVHVDDALYHSAFVKLFAATDNRAKNTYYYSDPQTLKVRFEQDDLDTTIKTNNIGQNRKPYYVEEHDKNSDGEFYWQGEGNGFYNLLESAFESELTTMMFDIFTAMASIKGDVMTYLSSRVLNAQDYFPAIAYNEIARLVYERAAVAQADGTYKNTAVLAITQSNGTLRWSEYQWLSDRFIYISSWCEYGAFLSGTSANNDLSFRGTNGHYAFVLTPAKWLYPRIGEGSSNKPASVNNRRVRVKAGETFHYQEFDVTTDTLIAIRGIDYYLDIGDFNIPLSPSGQTEFTFLGKRLQKISLNPSGEDSNNFKTKKISIGNATNIKLFVVRGVDTVTGEVDLSKCVRLEEIDMVGSTNTSIVLPDATMLKNVYYPASTTSVSIEDKPFLNSVKFEGVLNLSKLVLHNTSLNSYNVIMQCVAGNSPLTYISVHDVDWKDVSVETLTYLAEIDTTDIRGVIAVYELSTTANAITFDIKRMLVSKWGNIDNPDGNLYITYLIRKATEVKISGKRYLRDVGSYEYDVKSTNAYVNDFTNITLQMDENPFATISGTTVNVNQVSPTAFYTNLRGVYTSLDGTELEVEMKVGLFDRQAEPGDYVYYDGEYGKPDEWDKVTPVVGICFYVNPDDPTDRRMVRVLKRRNEHGFTWGLRTTSNPNVELADDPAYDVYKVNVYSTISFSSVENEYLVKDEVYRNGEDFVKYATTHMFGYMQLVELDEDIEPYKKGDIIPVGQYDTLKIIKHRNKILSDSSVNLEIPRKTNYEKEFDVFYRLYWAVVDDLAWHGTTTHYYYGATSACYAYEPDAKDINEKFTAHRWYNPSVGEFARIVWYWRKSWQKDADYGIFIKPFNDGFFPTWQEPPSNISVYADAAQAYTSTIVKQGESAFSWYGTSGDYIRIGDKSYFQPQRITPVCRF